MSAQKKSKLIACVSSDPGGAQAISAAARVLEREIGAGARFCTDERGFQVSGRDYEIAAAHGIEAWLERVGPDLILTGTSTRSELELSAIEAAEKMGRPSFTIVDHWTAMRARFDRGGRARFPRKIGVIDQRAVELATGEGLPAERLVIVGQPHWAAARTFSPSTSRDEFLRQLKIPESGKYLVFLSDSLLEEAGGDVQATRARWGYLETELAAAICEAAPKELSLVIQLHPKESPGKYDFLKRRYANALETQTREVLELIFHSAGCVGMFSSVLAQANCMGKPVCRFEPGSSPSSKDHLPIAGIPRFSEKSELARWLDLGARKEKPRISSICEKSGALVSAVQRLIGP